MNCSLPGSSVHGILQARILEWVAISSSRGSFPPRNPTHVSCLTSCALASGFFTTSATWETLCCDGCTAILLQEVAGSGKMTPSAGNPIISCPATLPHITELQLYFLHVQNLDSIQNTSYSGLGNVVFSYRKSALMKNCKNNLLGPKRLLTSDAVL